MYTSALKTHIIAVIVLCSPALSDAQYDSIFHEGLYRTYLLHLPTEYAAHDTFPLVIAMHGGFGSAYNIQNQSQLSEKADEENFVVVYPEGVKGGVLNIRTWNAGWCCGFASDSDIDDVGFIEALMDTLIKQYSIDINRIYATGMSNGGFMSYRLACELSGRIAAIAPVAASMSLAGCTPARVMPIIHFHSYIDSSVLYEGGIGNGISGHYNSPLDSILNVWASFNGCTFLNDTIINNNQYTFVQWTSCTCGAAIHYYITQDGGHSWPGGNPTPVGDPVSDYVNATDLMWSFFQQHSLHCGITSFNEVHDNPNGFVLFPNPTDGIMHIREPESLPAYTVTVYNPLGQVIEILVNNKTINLTGQPTGIYCVSIQTRDNITINKIIKTE